MANRTAAAFPIAGERVALRPLTEDDLASIEPWYREASALAGHNAVDTDDLRQRLAQAKADPDNGLVLIARRDDPSTPSGQAGAGIGLLEFSAGGPARRWLTCGFIAVAPALRGLGYGSEAVRLLEEEALRRGLANRFRAQVQPANGLCLYFWLRLGYRPAAEKSGASDTLTMIRTS